MRPAYAPHENLWYRQQSNQELHRRYMMNPSVTLDDNDGLMGSNNRLSNNANTPVNGVLNLSHDHQYTEPPRRRRISCVCIKCLEDFFICSCRNKIRTNYFFSGASINI